MSAASAHPMPVPAAHGALEPLRLFMLWLTGAAGSLVFIEPSPYEIASLAAIAVFAATGLRFRASLLPFAFLLVLINLGYTISSNALLGQKAILTWVLVSWYLAVTAVFFALALQVNTERRLELLMRGCIVAGVVAALAGVAGYFRLVPGASDMLLLYDRARGTFKDPNVFSAFLILPALLVLQRVITGNAMQAMRAAMLLGLFAAALLVSFSRGAWGQMVFAGGIVLFLTFVTSPSPHQRMRVVLLTGGGVAALAVLLAGLMSLDVVADLLKERLSLKQSYDVGEQGRFGRHLLGAIMALDFPLGIGPLQFSKFFPEDPHNTFLNAFVSGGWLSGLCYLTLVLLTLAFGLRPAFARTPWQPTAIVVYAAFAGVAAESVIIDIDHWRHLFLLLGVQWGLIAATQAHLAAARRADAIETGDTGRAGWMPAPATGLAPLPRGH